MENNKTESARDLMNELISEIAVSQEVLEILWVENRFFDEHRPDGGHCLNHINRSNAILDAFTLKFEKVMELTEKAFDAVVKLEKLIEVKETL